MQPFKADESCRKEVYMLSSNWVCFALTSCQSLFFSPSFWLFERGHVWITSLGPLMSLTLCLISNLEMTHTVLWLTTCECMWILLIDDREASTFEIQSQFVGFVSLDVFGFEWTFYTPRFYWSMNFVTM